MWHKVSRDVYQRLKRFTSPAQQMLSSALGESLEQRKEKAEKDIDKHFEDNRYNTAGEMLRMGLIDQLL